MASVKDIFSVLEAFAPCSYAEDYDNPGFLVGRANREVTGVVVALDVTSRAIDEALVTGANLIVSHHPVIFNARKSVTDEDSTGMLLLRLIENGISAICMHTNLDSAAGGVNDTLAQFLGVQEAKPVVSTSMDGVGGGRYGYLAEETDLFAFLKKVQEALSAKGLRYYNANRCVRKVAVGGGSCGVYLDRVRELGCDTFVTADIKHDVFLAAEELGINLIDAGHFPTEDIICPQLCSIMKKAFPKLNIRIADSDRDCVDFFTV